MKELIKAVGIVIGAALFILPRSGLPRTKIASTASETYSSRIFKIVPLNEASKRYLEILRSRLRIPLSDIRPEEFQQREGGGAGGAGFTPPSNRSTGNPCLRVSAAGLLDYFDDLACTTGISNPLREVRGGLTLPDLAKRLAPDPAKKITDRTSQRADSPLRDVGPYTGISINSNGEVDVEFGGCVGGGCGGVSTQKFLDTYDWIKNNVERLRPSSPNSGSKEGGASKGASSSSGSSGTSSDTSSDAPSAQADATPDPPDSSIPTSTPLEDGRGSLQPGCKPSALTRGASDPVVNPLPDDAPEGNLSFKLCMQSDRENDRITCPSGYYATPSPDGETVCERGGPQNPAASPQFRQPFWTDPRL